MNKSKNNIFFALEEAAKNRDVEQSDKLELPNCLPLPFREIDPKDLESTKNLLQTSPQNFGRTEEDFLSIKAQNNGYFRFKSHNETGIGDASTVIGIKRVKEIVNFLQESIKKYYDSWKKIESDDWNEWESPCRNYRIRAYGSGYTIGNKIQNCFHYLDSEFCYSSMEEAIDMIFEKEIQDEFFSIENEINQF